MEGGKLVYKRPMFAGNAYGYCTLNTPIQVATVRQSEVDPATPSGGSSPTEAVTKAALSAVGRACRIRLPRSRQERPPRTR